MNYVKVINGTAVPYSLSKLRSENPQTSFPEQIPDATLASYDVYPVVTGAMPETDIVKAGPIELIDGQWTQTYTGRDYTPEEKRPKMVVTMRQARLALLQQNLLSGVEAAIAAMPEPDRSQVAIEWEYASTVERLSPWMDAMGTALGLTDEQLDDLFVLAAEL